MKGNLIINGKDYRIRKLTETDVNNLQDLCERCYEFSLMTEGKMPGKKAGHEILNDLPPGKEIKDKFVFGVFDNNILVAVVDMVKDYKVKGEWIIGLLMIDPDYRGQRLGSKIHGLLKQWVIDNGGSFLRIGVFEENQRGYNFWSKLGYTEINRVKQTFGKKEHNTIVMSLPIK